MNPNSIHDFLLSNEKSLRIAAAVSEAWPEAREKLVLGFLQRLSVELEKNLPGWETKFVGGFFNERYSGFFVSKPTWHDDDYNVTLECHDYGKKMIFGVSRNENKEHIKRRPPCDELLDAVGKLHPSASARTWWEAMITLRSPAPDWRKPEVLWKMHTDRKFLDDVADQLCAVATVCEPIVDRLVQRK